MCENDISTQTYTRRKNERKRREKKVPRVVDKIRKLFFNSFMLFFKYFPSMCSFILVGWAVWLIFSVLANTI